MGGQLVIAELDAFRSVLGKVQPGEGETVIVWCRSTIANAVHRVGPTGPIKAAAEAAWAAADQFARDLDTADTKAGSMDQARERTLGALDALIATVRRIKMTASNGTPVRS